MKTYHAHTYNQFDVILVLMERKLSRRGCPGTRLDQLTSWQKVKGVLTMSRYYANKYAYTIVFFNFLHFFTRQIGRYPWTLKDNERIVFYTYIDK